MIELVLLEIEKVKLHLFVWVSVLAIVINSLYWSIATDLPLLNKVINFILTVYDMYYCVKTYTIYTEIRDLTAVYEIVISKFPNNQVPLDTILQVVRSDKLKELQEKS